jgi:hypothetical protein
MFTFKATHVGDYEGTVPYEGCLKLDSFYLMVFARSRQFQPRLLPQLNYRPARRSARISMMCS